MAFLRTLFWICVTVIVVVFSVRNWSPVTINLFGDMQADVKLPVLLLIAFLIGFGPLYIWHRVFKWRQGRKLAAIDRTLPPVAVQTPPQPHYAQAHQPAPAPDPFKAD
jgi:putative membrane protein